MKEPKATKVEEVVGTATPRGGNETKAEGLSAPAPVESYLYDALMSPFYDTLSAILWPQWVHPNTITLLGGIFCASAIYAFGLVGNNDNGDDRSASKKWACIGWTLYHMCDNMDGKHARRTQQTSTFGGFLDHTIDGFIGVYMGYWAVAWVVFACPAGSTLFNTGRHCFSMLWLAPHIVHQLEPQSGLVLGTKLCSVEEGFLAVSALLFYHGWIDADPLLPSHHATGLLLANTIIAIAAGYVVWSAVMAQSTKSRKYRSCWTAAYLLFAVIGYGAVQDPRTWWLLWVPFVMISVAAH